MAIIYLAHLVVPFVVIAWLGLAPLRTKRLLVLQIAGVGLFLAGLWGAGVWFYPPGSARWAHAALFLAAAWRAWRAIAPPSARRAAWAGAVGAAALATFGGFALWQNVVGRERPHSALDLAPPLSEGRFCVISGGASPLLNFHMATLAPEYSAFRGQSYGVDFVAIDYIGLRARSLAPQPRRFEDYRIYGAVIRAPCTGAVLSARNDLSDSPIGAPDRQNLPGNHVTLACEGYEVLLAHMQPGSVRVSVGDAVAVGAPIGVVGNSGNSDEPHLHLHAQRPPAPGDPPQAGAPVHVTFAGRYLARGDCLR